MLMLLPSFCHRAFVCTRARPPHLLACSLPGAQALVILMKMDPLSLPPAVLASMLATIALIAGPLILLPLFWPARYERWRVPLVVATRLLWFSMSNVKSGEAVFHVLQASPGLAQFLPACLPA